MSDDEKYAEDSVDLCEVSKVNSEDIIQRQCLPLRMEYEVNKDDIIIELKLRNIWEITIQLKGLSLCLSKKTIKTLKLPDREMDPGSVIEICLDEDAKTDDLEWILPMELRDSHSIHVFLCDSNRGKRYLGSAITGITEAKYSMPEEVRKVLGHEIRQELGETKMDIIGSFVRSMSEIVAPFVGVDYVDLEEKISFEGHLGDINAVSLSEDGRYLYSGSKDGCIAKFDLCLCKCVRMIEAHSNYAVNDVAYAGEIGIVTAGADGTVKLFDSRLNQVRLLLKKCNEMVSVYPNQTGVMVVCRLQNGQACVIDIQTGAFITELSYGDGIESKFSSAMFLDNHTILSVSAENKFRIWDAHTGKCLRSQSIIGHRNFPHGCAINKEHTLIATVGSKMTIIWNFPELTESSRFYHTRIMFNRNSSVVFNPLNQDSLVFCSPTSLGLIETRHQLFSESVSLRRGFVKFTPDNSRVIYFDHGELSMLQPSQDIWNKEGMTALMIAESKGHTYAIALLKEANP